MFPPLRTAQTILVDVMGNGIDGGLIGIPPGGISKAKFLVGFPDTDGRGYRWALYFNPSLYPGSEFVTVTRGMGPDSCTWTIEAAPNAVAGLILFNVAKGSLRHDSYQTANAVGVGRRDDTCRLGRTRAHHLAP